ncbi:cytokine receptor-like factor 3 [Limulus polyphemus]|uniref:Cytokine receptor-like factor 3 n=1 Tax=Limulus polyphemus TaxID=6850 RepID=A0ABM1BEG0_LIMPO|nr:cytokine receptor-like factor 3 [Limulus polyphemus]
MANAKVKVTLEETVSCAKDYQKQLQDLLLKLDEAEAQLKRSAEDAREYINSYFKDLTEKLLTVIKQRQENLSNEITIRCKEKIKPLSECRYLIEDKLETAVNVCMEGEHILIEECDISSEDVKLLCDKSQYFGSLPEVPAPSEVPHFSVDFNSNLYKDLMQAILSDGVILVQNAIEITNVEEKPGALVVHWNEIDDENNQEPHKYHLQCCRGDARNNPEVVSNFYDVYKGNDTHYIIRDVECDVPYSFRVSRRPKNDSNFGPWSLIYTSTTTLPPYEWDHSNIDYMLTNERKIATKLYSDSHSVLCSKTPLLSLPHSLHFRILDVGKTPKLDEGIALIDASVHTQSTKFTFLQQGVVFINLQGVVFVNGYKMMTELLPLCRGSSVYFYVEPLDSNKKVRVMIESGDGQITYDWKTVQDTGCKYLDIYFGMFFREEGWKIVVE